MVAARFSDFLRCLTRQMGTEGLADQSDAQLAARALAGPDGSAFEAIVRRHGDLVYRVCWRVLQHPQDTEDAFQATFLVLAQKLRSVRKHASLASWLHGVARRVAVKAKQQAVARRQREAQAPVPETAPPEDLTWKELRSALDAELEQMPDRWRLPLILCYLEGRTQDEAARQLGWSTSKLRRHLDRGRAALRQRLARRGITAPAALAGLLLSEGLAPAAGLVAATVEAAAGVAAGKTVSTTATTVVAALTERMVQAMFLAKLKTVLAVVVSLGVVAGLALGCLAVVETRNDLMGQAPPPAPKEEASARTPPLKVGDRVHFGASSLNQYRWRYTDNDRPPVVVRIQGNWVQLKGIEPENCGLSGNLYWINFDTVAWYAIVPK